MVIIPKEAFIEIQQNNRLTVAEAKKIEATYTNKVTDRVLAQMSEISEEMYFVCGGVYWEDDPERLSSMQLVGVTEKWIPERVKASNLLVGILASHSEVQFDWLIITKDSEQTLEISHKVQGL